MRSWRKKIINSSSSLDTRILSQKVAKNLHTRLIRMESAQWVFLYTSMNIPQTDPEPDQAPTTAPQHLPDLLYLLTREHQSLPIKMRAKLILPFHSLFTEPFGTIPGRCHDRSENSHISHQTPPTPLLRHSPMLRWPPSSSVRAN